MVMSTFQRHYLLVLDFVYAFTYQEFDIMSIAYLHCQNAGRFDYVYIRSYKRKKWKMYCTPPNKEVNLLR